MHGLHPEPVAERGAAAAPPRRYPIGAECHAEGVHLRLWAPRARQVSVVLEIGEEGAVVESPLLPEEGGYHAGRIPGACAGSRYRLRLDGAAELLPDPASRFQPEGPHGPSEVIDPALFRWTDAGWGGARLRGQVIYEMHVGTFTPEGTWAAARAELDELARCGVTLLEVMPIAEFAGRFGWGYDGVDLFAPTRLYGRPDDLRAFVDRAHALGLGVLLDVVYNHLGPDGNYLARFSADYFTDRYGNEWGDAINFDGPGAGAVRELFRANAAYWVDEFHLDGLRLDATQQIFDSSPVHILREVTEAARKAAGARPIVVVAENERQDARLVRPAAAGGMGLDALWNDDLHHAAVAAATGKAPAYYSDTPGRPQELVSAVKWGFLYQGQRYSWQEMRRGHPALDLPPEAFVAFLENHDQVANSARGERLHRRTSPGRHRALTALLLLAPWTPMLFQGQEFSSSAPFLYFADHAGELGRLVREGRERFLEQFEALALPEVRAQLPPPGEPATFARCKLDHGERARNAAAVALHRDLLALRRSDPVFSAARKGTVDGAVLGAAAFVLRWLGGAARDRLLVVNLGGDLRLVPAPEPLLAPPEGARWRVLWASDDPAYGGEGTPELDREEEGWLLPGEAAVALAPEVIA